MDLRIQVMESPLFYAGNRILHDWTKNIEGLHFGTNAFGGFTAISFTLKYDFNTLWYFMEPYSRTCVLAKRLVVVDPFGLAVYEGLLSSLQLDLGGQGFSRSLENFFSAVRLDHKTPYDTNMVRTSAYDYAAVNRFGIKVAQMDNGNLIYPAQQPSGPAYDIVQRLLKNFAEPQRFSGTKIGGVGTEVIAQVTGMGLHSTLDWRYAYNHLEDEVDTSQVVKWLIQNGSPTWQQAGGWTEKLYNATYGFLPYGQQFLTDDASQIDASGMNCPANEGQGSKRLEIIRSLLKYGATGETRALFQVFQTKNGKGRVHFRKQKTDLPYSAGYDGYYYSAKNNLVLNRDRAPIPLYQVRAGRWLTLHDADIVGTVAPGTLIQRDPRCMFIEDTDYDADRDELSIGTTNDFDLRRLLGIEIRDRRVIFRGIV